MSLKNIYVIQITSCVSHPSTRINCLLLTSVMIVYVAVGSIMMLNKHKTGP